MSYIQPDFIVNVSQDKFISLVYDSYEKKEGPIKRKIETDEINNFMHIPFLPTERKPEGTHTFGNIEEKKFSKDKLVLATIHEKGVINKVLYINENGELNLEEV